MLALTLERLSQANQRPADVRIYADTHANLEEVRFVRDTYLPEANLFHQPPHITTPSGCWNILDSIKKGFETGAEFVFLIEEDIAVYPDFFNWHWSQTDCLASCGRKDRHHFPLYGPLYTNPGSCLRRPLLERLVPHINDDYFSRLHEYLDEHFGTWDTQSNLDDGLIRRVIRQMDGRAVYPDTPVCAHQGFRFYNKLDLYMNEGTIQERIAGLRKMIASIKPGDRYAADFEPY